MLVTRRESVEAASPVRVGLVLSAGGLRGAAHLGVLHEIERRRIPVHVIVGVSAGAIVGAYYAAVGLTVSEMIDDAPTFRGSHILMHGLALRARPAFIKRWARRLSGIIPARLQQLEAGEFGRLHHGVQALGIVCHDVTSRQPYYFSTSNHAGVRLSDVVRASAAVPGVMPPKAMTVAGREVRLADGGISDSLPVAFATSPDLGATHLIVSDCRQRGGALPSSERLIYIRPELDGIRTLRAPRRNLMEAVRLGEAAVTPRMLRTIESWID
jgi:NTE family protein